MQMLDAYTTIAHAGVSVPPRLLSATIGPDGHKLPIPLKAGHRVVSAGTAAAMTGMLEGVVSNGTGACAAVPGYTVAGKTGTARKALPQGGYSDTTMASFIGYVPANNPRLAAIVVLDEPKNQYGGAAAAPVFSEIMQFAITQYRVPPDDPGNTQYTAAQATAQHSGTPCAVPNAAALATSGGMTGTAQRTNTGAQGSATSLPADTSQTN
jgi:cell division protein FtsI (penicillin-binding protein 3)